jgi:hypothetical protein
MVGSAFTFGEGPGAAAKSAAIGTKSIINFFIIIVYNNF